jgi:hypothetical protein
MLSQLSYAPRKITAKETRFRLFKVLWVGLPRLERGTSVLSGLRSSQLSYRPTRPQGETCGNWRVRNRHRAAQTTGITCTNTVFG